MAKEKKFMRMAGLITLLFLVINANAISDQDLADTYYQKAGEAYDAGDCANASELAGRALTLYTTEADRLKTLELIGEINVCLRKNGDSYYQKASEHFNKGEYGDCVTWAMKAEEQYSLIPYPLGVSECAGLIADAEIELNKTRIEEANKLFETAVKLYDSEDMPHAEAKAKEALDVYTELGYTKGVKDCNDLLSEINDWVIQKTQEAETKYGYADEQYRKAVKNNEFVEYNTALEYATEAKTLFDKVGDKEGYAKSRDLINLINADVEGLEDEFNAEADSYYAEGVREFLYGMGAKEKNTRRIHFNKVKSEVGEARSIYALLYDWAASLKDSSVSEQKKKLYRDKIQKCDDKLEDTERELRYMRLQEEAEGLYLEANTFFIQGYCRNATESVSNASSLFKEIEDYSGISKCDTLMGQINECLGKLESADKYYEQADTCLKKMDFENFTSYLQKARDKYGEINYMGGVEKCDLLKNELAEVVEKKRVADELLTEADMLYGQKDYVRSNETAWKARVIYEEIGYEGGVSDVDSLIGKNEEAMDEAHRRSQLITMITVGVILAAILITIAIWWVRKTREERLEEEKIMRERKRLEEELRLRKEGG